MALLTKNATKIAKRSTIRDDNDPHVRIHLHALREAMTGRNDAPTKKAVLVVDIKQVFCMLSSSSRLVDRSVILVALFLKVLPNAGSQNIEEYESIWIIPSQQR